MPYREKIPKKITPDRIKESMVHIGLESSLNFPVSLGYFHSLFLESGYTYQSNSDSRDERNFFQHYFFNEKKGIFVYITPYGLTFNCIEKYIGWTVYGKEIISLITKLFENEVILKITRMGIRYISEFPGSDLYKMVNLSVSSSFFTNDNDTGRISFERFENENRIIVNLIITKNLKPFTQAAKSSKELSIIDVDIIRKDLNIDDFRASEKLLISLHQKEKQVFFSLLNDDFLSTLKPEY